MPVWRFSERLQQRCRTPPPAAMLTRAADERGCHAHSAPLAAAAAMSTQHQPLLPPCPFCTSGRSALPQATSNAPGNLELVKSLEEHSAFNIHNPNNCYSLFLGFSRSPVNFHAADGSGYKWMADAVIKVGVNYGRCGVSKHPKASSSAVAHGYKLFQDVQFRCNLLLSIPQADKLNQQLVHHCPTTSDSDATSQPPSVCIPPADKLNHCPTTSDSDATSQPPSVRIPPADKLNHQLVDHCPTTSDSDATSQPPSVRIPQVDKLNHQVAARMASAFSTYRQFDSERQAMMKAQLQRIVDEQKNGLSENVYEIASKSLA
eukprot:355343-Chlamydomonas_euryale.AAC.8